MLKPFIKTLKTDQRGVTLIELMVAIFIMGVAVIGLMGTFGSIKVGIQVSKNRTVASNLCKEKLESLKNYSYDRLRVTSQTDLDTYGYDNTYFPPETNLQVAGVPFNRYIRVKKAWEDAGKNIVDVSSEDPDTGLKKVEVLVKWTETDQTKQYSMVSLMDDPNRQSLDGTVSGVVYKSPGGAGNELAQVLVVIQDNPSWTTRTNSSGYYSLHLSTGSHIIQFSKSGYYSSSEITITANPTATQNCLLSPRGTGSAYGWAYIRDHLVISQVVADTDTINAEYVELYNPSTWTWTINDSTIKLLYIDKDNNSPGFGNSQDITPSIAFNTGSIAANGGYYLIASTSPIRVCGVSVTPDAVYSLGSSPGYVLQQDEAGGIILQDGAGNTLDSVAWSKTISGHGAPSLAIESSEIPLSKGLGVGEQIVRWDMNVTNPLVSGNGRSWDSNDNSHDFNKQVPTANKDMSIQYAPKNSSSVNPPQAGTPAVGAVVSADDDLSSPTTVSASPPGYFHLTGIATSTLTGATTGWIVSISSYSLYGSSIGVTALPGLGQYVGVIVLSSPSVTGLVTGTVSISTGGVMGGIKVRCGATETTTNGSGLYQLVLSAGTGFTIAANPGNYDPNYTYDTYPNPLDISAGQSIGGINFTLYAAGKITGRVTSNGTDPLPNVVVNAEAPSGTQRGTAGSDGAGYFTIANIPISALTGVGTYTVSPGLDPQENSSPSSLPATVTMGTTVNVGTFTVSGSMGRITGAVTKNGQAITTGVIVLATLDEIDGDPPDWNETLRNGSTLYYSAHSTSNGSYDLSVRASTSTYHVYAWYSEITGETVTTTKKDGTVMILNSVTPYTVNFNW